MPAAMSRYIIMMTAQTQLHRSWMKPETISFITGKRCFFASLFMGLFSQSGQMNLEQGDFGWGNAVDSGGLSQGQRSNFDKFCSGLIAQSPGIF